MMNQTIKEEWVTRLKSGEYNPGRFALKQIIDGDICYCPLGVLVEMYQEEFEYGWVQIEDRFHFMSFGASLPPPVLDWAGLRGAYGPVIPLNGVYRYVPELFDNGICTMPEIASLIEKHF